MNTYSFISPGEFVATTSQFEDLHKLPVSRDMYKFTKNKLPMICSYVGVYSLFLTIGVQLYWGNLSVYTNSYFRNSLGAVPDIKTPWVISLFAIGFTVNTILAGYIASFIGQRCTLILGCFLLDSGIFLTYFCIQRSVIEVNLSMGLITGMGSGMALSIGFQTIVSFEPKNVGLMTGILETAISIGSGVFNQVITLYVNPTNLTPDLYEDQEKYFTQRQVLDRVPSTFLVLGFANVSCHVIGVVLLRPQRETDKEKRVAPAERFDNAGDVEAGEPLVFPSTELSLDDEEEEKHETTARVQASTEHLNLREILKSRCFYIMWISFGISNYSYIVMNNYYKLYGQMWISDDQLLANLSTALLFAMMLMRPCWGAILDKYGVKTTIVYLSFAISVVSSLWYFTPMVSQWMFFLWTIIYGCCNSGLYIVFPSATLKLFGKDNFSRNYGLIISSCIFLNMAAPSLMRGLLGTFGWFYIFFSVASANALGMILFMVMLPET